jgi:sRNA-binding regulator protein Hfq
VSSYWVEKSRCPVTIVLTDGREMSGEIFLNPMSRHHVAPQQPAEFLNQPEPFFILAPSYDERVLVAKASIAIVEAPLPSSDDDDQIDKARVGVGLEIELIGSSLSVVGWLFYKATEGKGRVQDYLNDLTDQFIVLFDAEKTTLVSRHAVANVRETT